ncbi:MAG: CopD family protein [Anaerolineales bacterium]|nr:CopD family protein [Anaerolineales bacterium]MCB8990793.1 CopD family protein [Ardenticatenaceae bacterium]MCB9005729.1 CopD family protein [Ardenticatenaceae bacterium]
MNLWILAASYWIHLLATAVWLGGIALLTFIAWPALRNGTLTANQWLALQKRFLPWANGSLVLLLITGFVQMTNDPNYHGFLTIDGVWAGAILIKHIAFGAMALISGYMQWALYPAMNRTSLLLEKKPALAKTEQAALQQKEIRLLRLNLICAVAVLLCTAVATAV